MGYLSTTRLYYIIIRPTLNEHINENITYYYKKTPKLVAKIWLPNFVLYQSRLFIQLLKFFGATPYITFYYDQFMNKIYVEDVQNISHYKFPYCYQFKVHCQKTHHNHIKYLTSSNWYVSMTFTDFQWLFQAKCCFSRPGLEGFGQYPVFTVVFTSKYRPGKTGFGRPKWE